MTLTILYQQPSGLKETRRGGPFITITANNYHHYLALDGVRLD